ncbi:MAG: hypothetical protein LBC65_02545 [Oscillospiraceae bacterium]|jgi:hypothetical protein|nr:hypothetical protein [Oscillospiraceae bacterium]
MKKAIALIVAGVMLAALVAGCDNTSATPSDASSSSPSATQGSGTSPSPSGEGTSTTAAEPASYPAGEIAPPKLPAAADTLAVNSDGTLKYELADTNYPLNEYDYELPLTTDSTTYTYFDITFILESMIPADGKGTMDYYTMVRNKTGVNIDYQWVPSDITVAQTQFSIAMAADELCDITAWGSYLYTLAGSGTQSDMVDQNWFANIADYRAYAPNFMFQIPRYNYDPDLIANMWLNDEMIVLMGPFTENPMPSTGYLIRGDWLDRLEIKASDIKTYDQLFNVWERFKNEIITAPDGYPFSFFAYLEPTSGQFFGGYDTGILVGTPLTRVVDKKVTFTMTDVDDYEPLQLFLEIQEKGWGNPNFGEYNLTQAMLDLVQSDRLGMINAYAGEIGSYEANNSTPGARWDAIASPRKTENQKLKYGHGQSEWQYTPLGWCFSAKSKNIPLLVSYADYFYSDEGSFDGTWGIEGVTYEYDSATGEPHRTEFAYANKDGHALAWIMLAYNQSKFTEPFRCMYLSDYTYPGGERYRDFFYTWSEVFYKPVRDGSAEYDWPSATAKLTLEQQQEVNTYISDANTWYAENYQMFIDGTRPLTPETWAEYMKELNAIGYERYRNTMQVVFDEYLARRNNIIAGTN